MLPEFAKLRWQNRLGDVDHLTHERFGLWTKRQVDPSFSAEQIRDDGIAAALYAFKEQRGTTLRDDAAMNLSELEVGIDLGFDGDDLVFSVEKIEKCAQAGVHRLYS